MHRHLTLAHYGQYLGVRGGCLVVRDEDGECEYPLNRLKSILIAKRGVSMSSDVILACAGRGIKLFVCDFRNQVVAGLAGAGQHAVVEVRHRQFRAMQDDLLRHVAARIVMGKLRNQRSTLLYFGKYHRDHGETIGVAAERLATLAAEVRDKDWARFDGWRDIMLGLEGQGAALYWQCLRETGLLPQSFPGRTGRNATDATNMALNYGYAILMSYVWNAVLNAGLEPYAGIYHAPRPGKPSLVLDLMEEYRPWVVDRAVVKRRTHLANKKELSLKVRKGLIADVHRTFAARYPYHRRRLHLESILQRQVYRLGGVFADGKTYRPYVFKW